MTITRDFILDKTKYKQVELDQRFAICQGRRIFDRQPKSFRVVDNKTEPEVILKPLPPCEDEREDFQKRCNVLRRGVVDMWHIRIGHMSIVGLHIHCPELKDRVKCLNDFIKMYKGIKQVDKRIRKIVHMFQNKAITKQMMVSCEEDIKSVLGIEYDNRLSNGTTCPTNRQTGCLLTIGQRVKQTKQHQPVRVAGFLAHNEVQYGREKKLDPDSGKLKNVMAGVVNCFKMVEEEHGVDGWLGVGAYHYTQVEIAKKQPKIKLPGGNDGEGFKDWLLQRAKNEPNNCDIVSLVAEWESEQAKKAPEVTVCSNTSTVSPITTNEGSETPVSLGMLCPKIAQRHMVSPSCASSSKPERQHSGEFLCFSLLYPPSSQD